ncbi:MAG: HesA/MoeB/ThiF family protein [Anaerolineaceae bacterium]|jgi:molybdopterin/thiamine biosynthesis adenylyltransferase
MDRYIRNKLLINNNQQMALGESRIAIVGCGGLGGAAASNLVRLGVKNLILIDGDSFHASNLNRQRYAFEDTLGQPKTDATAKELLRIDKTLQVEPRAAWMEADNAVALLSGASLVLDCLDNIPTRLILEDACCEAGLPLVHAALGDWYGQVGVVLPGQNLLHKLYGSLEPGDQSGVSALSPIVEAVAALQSLAAAGFLLQSDGTNIGSIRYYDFKAHQNYLLTF